MAGDRPSARAGRLWLRPVASTNRVATWLGQQGWSQPLWVLATTQTGGVGRRGSRWESPSGGLWASLLLPAAGTDGQVDRNVPDTSGAPAGLNWLPLLMAGAVAQVTRTWCGLPARLKWPNDVLVGSRKLAGVLATAQTMAGQPRYFVIGVGVNVNVDLVQFSAALRDQVVSVSALTGRRWPLPVWLDRLEAAWWPWYQVWRRGDIAGVRQGMMARWFTPGQPVLVSPKDGRSTPAGPFLAQLVELDAQGHAVVWVGDREQALDPSQHSLRLLNLARPSVRVAGLATR